MGGITSDGRTILDPGEVLNQHISPLPTQSIKNAKVQPYVYAGTHFNEQITTVLTGVLSGFEFIVFVAPSAGQILGFHGKYNSAGVGTSMTVTLNKNGVSQGTLTIGNTTAVVDGACTSTFAKGDVLSLSLTGTGVTGNKGPFAWVSLFLNNAPGV